MSLIIYLSITSNLSCADREDNVEGSGQRIPNISTFLSFSSFLLPGKQAARSNVTLRTSLADAERKCAALQASLDTAQEQIARDAASSEMGLQRLTSENERLKANLGENSRQMIEAKREIERLKNLVAEVKGSNEGMITDRMALRKQLSSSEYPEENRAYSTMQRLRAARTLSSLLLRRFAARTCTHL